MGGPAGYLLADTTGRNDCTHKHVLKHNKHVVALLVHGVVIRAKSEVVAGPCFGTKAARYFLLHLGHSYAALTLIIGKRHVDVAQETQHFIGMLTQPPQQIGGLTLFDSAALIFAPINLAGIEFFTLRQQALILRGQCRNGFSAQRLTLPIRLKSQFVAGNEELCHPFRPFLRSRFSNIFQFPQQVRIAQCVLAQ